MTQRISPSGRAWLSLCWCLLTLLLIACPTGARGDSPPGMATYCSVPPIPGAGVRPNLLLLLDNSASMYDPAYTDTSTPPKYCIDGSYDNSYLYVGYFDPKSIYRYQPQQSVSLKNRMTQEMGNFVPAPSETLSASRPSCNRAGTSYLCINTSGSANQMDSFLATGNFLNWLAMSKLDIEKRALTGGKLVAGGNLDPTATASGMLQAETRGCQNRSFIKTVPDAPVTFAVRGPNAWEDDYVEQQGGMTRVDVYTGSFDTKDCCNAVAAWQAGDLTALVDSANKCTGSPTYSGGTPTMANIFIEIMTDCYGYLAGRDITPDKVTTLQNYCGVDYAQYQNSAGNIPRGNGDAVCGTGYYHNPVMHGASLANHGFIGQCYTFRTGFGSYSQAQTCILGQIQDFCLDIQNPPLMDPSASATMTGTNADLPAFIFAGGVASLGNPAGTLLVRLATDPAAPPAGLVQQYNSDINFAAMVFNTGSGAECGGAIPCTRHCQEGPRCDQNSDCKTTGNCIADPRSDGGKIISYPGSSGNPSGLVKALNAVQANTWSPLSESFYEAIGYFARDVRFQLQPGDFDGGAWFSPGYSCQRNNVLVLTDGASTADRAPALNAFVAKGWLNLPAGRVTRAGDAVSDPPGYQGSYNLDDLAWIARNKNVTNAGSGPGLFDYTGSSDANWQVQHNRDFLSTYVVYTGAASGDATPVYNADGSCGALDESKPEKMMQLVACKGGGKFASARSPNDLQGALGGMLQQIGSGTNSGTDASLLATGQANGALFLQEQFYPSRSFEAGTSATWIGEMQSLWYYIDPFLGASTGSASTIREDSDGDLKLQLRADRIVNLRYDAASDQTYALLTSDPAGDGSGAGGSSTRVRLDQLKSLWAAGKALWARDLAAAPRTLYTPLLLGGTPAGSTGLMLFSYGTPGSPGASGNAAPLAPYLQLPDVPSAQKLIQYLHGFDFPGDGAMRSRTVSMGGVPASASDPLNTGVGVWKLGDIISSTAALQSAVPLGAYQLASPAGYHDNSYGSFVNSNQYQSRARVYVGANDGMLHAFSLGKLATAVSGEVKATLSGSDAGQEKWAFLPKNVLPYLKYLSDPAYRHLYYVDGRSTLVDASIGDSNSGACVASSYWNCPKPRSASVVDQNNNLVPANNSWRTVLIGSMGLGGASARSCAGGNCVPVPGSDPADGTGGAGLGYSSYFALDVSDPDRPVLLWEFSNPALGFATTGPAVVRLGDPEHNGRWFAVFGSGPAGPIDPGTHQFLGRSDRKLSFFVVDLRSGALVATITPDTPASAFVGSLSGGGIDAERWNPNAEGAYQDDAIYAGYVKKGADGAWSDGGVGRLLIDPVDTPSDANLSDAWHWSTVVDGIGPVTAGIAKLQDRKNHNLWLYFASGRYFFPGDDPGSVRSLFGVKEPCYNFPVNGVAPGADSIARRCSAALDPARLVDRTGSGGEPVAGRDPGWRIDLDSDSGAPAERAVTAPTSSTGGVVFFPTYQPSADPCHPGTSYLWGVRYNSGGPPATPLKGKVLVQLSNGSVVEADRSGRDGRRSSGATGRPGGIKVVTNSGLKALKKIIHIQER
jgi:type IV pilus assembly protein PilY1